MGKEPGLSNQRTVWIIGSLYLFLIELYNIISTKQKNKQEQYMKGYNTSGVRNLHYISIINAFNTQISCINLAADHSGGDIV